jgi:hypothetical protein
VAVAMAMAMAAVARTAAEATTDAEEAMPEAMATAMKRVTALAAGPCRHVRHCRHDASSSGPRWREELWDESRIKGRQQMTF